MSDSVPRRPGPLAAAKGVSYRAETDEDVTFLEALYASTRAQEVASTGWSAELQRSFLGQQFALQRGHYRRHYPDAEWLVIEHGGAPVGRLYIEEWETQMRVIDIALVPASRGLGLGAAILGDVIGEMESRGKAVSIHVERNNPAMGLYVRLGFEKVDEHGIYYLMHRNACVPAAAPQPDVS